MDLDSGRIWDYSSDSYVHRLLEDKIGASSLLSKTGSRAKVDETSVAEFEDLLAAQLESQRLYYEGQVSSAVNKASKATKEIQTTEQNARDLQNQLKEKEDLLHQQAEELRSLRESQNRLESKTKIFSDVARQCKIKLNEEKLINESLMRRISHFEQASSQVHSQRTAMEAEMTALQEQVRDLMAHFASVEQIRSLALDDLDSAKVRNSRSSHCNCRELMMSR